MGEARLRVVTRDSCLVTRGSIGIQQTQPETQSRRGAENGRRGGRSQAGGGRRRGSVAEREMDCIGDADLADCADELLRIMHRNRDC